MCLLCAYGRSVVSIERISYRTKLYAEVWARVQVNAAGYREKYTCERENISTQTTDTHSCTAHTIHTNHCDVVNSIGFVHTRIASPLPASRALSTFALFAWQRDLRSFPFSFSFFCLYFIRLCKFCRSQWVRAAAHTYYNTHILHVVQQHRTIQTPIPIPTQQQNQAPIQ